MAKVYLSVIALVFLPGYFLTGPILAGILTALALLAVLIWNNVSPGIVLQSLKASRMTDASATASIIHRLFMGDVKALREAAGMSGIQLYLIDTHVPLAFSMGIAKGTSQIVLTSGLFKTLTRLEVSAVIAHELGHIRAGDSALNAMRLSLSLMVNRLGIRPFLRLFSFILPPKSLLAAVMLKPECRADAFAAKLCRDGRILASALKKLERGVRAVQWSALDKLPFLAEVTVVNPFAAQKSDAQPQNSKTAHRVAELYRLEPYKTAA